MPQHYDIFDLCSKNYIYICITMLRHCGCVLSYNVFMSNCAFHISATYILRSNLVHELSAPK